MKKINILVLFVLVLTACVPQSSSVTSVPQFTETIAPIAATPHPTASPTAVLIPETETKLSKDAFLFPCDSNTANVIPLQKDMSVKLLGHYGELAVVTAYNDKTEVCGLVALADLENEPLNSVPLDFFSISEPVNAIPLFKSSEDYPRLLVENSEKVTIDNTIESDTKDGYYLAFNNDEPFSTEHPFVVSLRFDSKGIGGITIFGKPRDWSKDWWQDVTFLEITCDESQCNASFFDGTSEDSQSLISFVNDPKQSVQILFQDPLGNGLDFIFPDGRSEHFELHAPLFPDQQMEVGAQAGPNSMLEINEYLVRQVPPSRAPQVITPENVADIQLLATWGKGTPWSTIRIANPDPAPIQFADDGNIIVVQTLLGVFLYDKDSGGQVNSIYGPTISQVSDDGKLLATGHADGAVKVWNILDLELIGEYSVKDFIVDPTPQIWDRYKFCQSREEYLSPTVLAFSNGGNLIAAGYCDGVTGVWDIQNPNKMSLVWSGFLGQGNFDFSKNDQYLSILHGVWLYKLNVNTIDGLPSIASNFQDFDISPDGEKIVKIYCEETDCKIRIAPVQDPGQVSRSFVIDKDESSPIVTYSEDGQNIVVDFPMSGERLIVDANTGQVTETVSIPLPPELPNYHWLIERGHMNGMQKFGTAGLYKGLDGQSILSTGLAWGTTGTEIYWWNVVDNTVKFYPQEISDIAFPSTGNFPSTEAQSIFFSADGSQAAWCKESQLVIFFEKTGERKAIPLPLHRSCDGIAISPDDDKLAVWTGNRISLVSISSNEIQTLVGHKQSVSRIIFSPDGSLMASTTGSTEVFLWQINPVKNLYQMYANYVDTLDFSPDSKILMGVGVSKGSIMHIWNTENGTDTRMDVRGKSAAFSPARDLLVTGFGDGYIVLRSMPTGEQLSIFKAHEEIIEPQAGTKANLVAVYFLPDGTGFISFGPDGLIKLWGVR